MTDRVYVSITGLKLRRPWHIFSFYLHATLSFRQARRAAGNLRSEARSIHGVHHTLTVWKSEAAMRAFLGTGAHARALKAFARMATGATFGFETDRVPSWDEIPRLWRERGRRYR